MTFTGLDTEPSSPSPPDGAGAPPSCDAAAEPTAASEVHEPESPQDGPTEKSANVMAPHARPPAASLVSIPIKHKPAGPTKAGDLTRFFELAHRQARTPAPSEPPSVAAPPATALEVESAPATVPTATLAIELPVAEAVAEPAPLETTPEPPPAETAALPEAVALPEVTTEPSFPLMLAPPATKAEDLMVPAPAEPAPASVVDIAVVAEPAWSADAAGTEADFSSETIEPLNVSFVLMDETAAAAHEPTQADTEPAAAETAITEPASPLVTPLQTSETAVPAPVEPASVATLPMPVAPPVPTFNELADYWRSLRNGADHPPTESIDRDLVTERWPGSLLITYTPASHDPRSELRPGRVTRLGTACAETQNVVDAGSHSTEWMLEVAHTALINDEPVEEQQRLSTLKGVAGFRMVALPLGSPTGLANAILCTLLPCPGAPRFGKRRIWL